MEHNGKPEQARKKSLTSEDRSEVHSSPSDTPMDVSSVFRSSLATIIELTIRLSERVSGRFSHAVSILRRSSITGNTCGFSGYVVSFICLIS